MMSVGDLPLSISGGDWPLSMSGGDLPLSMSGGDLPVERPSWTRVSICWDQQSAQNLWPHLAVTSFAAGLKQTSHIGSDSSVCCTYNVNLMHHTPMFISEGSISNKVYSLKDMIEWYNQFQSAKNPEFWVCFLHCYWLTPKWSSPNRITVNLDLVCLGQLPGCVT